MHIQGAWFEALIATGSTLTGVCTTYVAMSKASGKRFKDFESRCDLKYASKDSQSKTNVEIGKILTSITNIEKDIETMGHVLRKKLS